MESYRLNFAEIVLLREDIAEVIVDEGVEMNEAMVDEYHNFLLSHLRAPFSLLVNKVHSYCYDFTAQRKLATLEQIRAMAVVSYSRATELATDYLAHVPRERQWNLRIFSNREAALEWLLAQQASASR